MPSLEELLLPLEELLVDWGASLTELEKSELEEPLKEEQPHKERIVEERANNFSLLFIII